MNCYKVFYKEKWIELVENQNGKVLQGMKLEYENGQSFDYAIKLLDTREDLKSIKIEYSNADLLFAKLLKYFKNINAAGGLVENEEGKVLVIFRNGRWDLPKGKLKRFEDEKEGAIREVMEECGVDNLKVTDEFSATFHLYELKGKIVIKKTWWFLMKCDGEQKLIPQIEEGITKVEWFEKQRLDEVLGNTYSSIVQVIEEYKRRFMGTEN
ncbi:MAG: NUDIX domain-containing protein [Bacteroidetes bacterium]|nr:NUDIX domain-containing protein [Bacteroidota bacterium]